MTSVASSFSGPQLFTLSASYGVHEETVLAGPSTTLEQLAQLLRRGGGCALLFFRVFAASLGRSSLLGGRALIAPSRGRLR